MSNWYRILRDGSVEQVADLLEWARWFEGASPALPISEGGCLVSRTELTGGVVVSTVFLGTDHGWGRRVALFETMIFGGPRDQYQERYATFEGAKEGHEKAVGLALAPDDDTDTPKPELGGEA